MKVLVACESSGTMRNALTELGHYAVSCDIEPDLSPGSGEHYQGDVFDLLPGSWDMVIAFPPCTYLCKAQMWRCSLDPDRASLRDEAVEFVKRIWYAADRVVIENPIGHLSATWQRPNQIIYPWWFGDPYRKDICLWLKDVPPVIATCYNTIRKPISNHVNGRMSQAEKSRIKSSWKYFPKMAQALALQWCGVTHPSLIPS